MKNPETTSQGQPSSSRGPRGPLATLAIILGIIGFEGSRQSVPYRQPDGETCALLAQGKSLEDHTPFKPVYGVLPGQGFVSWKAGRTEPIVAACRTDHGIAVTRNQVLAAVRNNDPDKFLPGNVRREALGIILIKEK